MKKTMLAIALCSVLACCFGVVGAQEPPPPADPNVVLSFVQRIERLLEAFLNSGTIAVVGAMLALPLRLFPKFKNAFVPIVLGIGNVFAVAGLVIKKLFEAQAGIVMTPETDQIYFAGLGSIFMPIVTAGWSAVILAAQRGIWEHGLRKLFPNIANPVIEVVPINPNAPRA